MNEAEGQLKSDPLAAYFILDRLATEFRGTQLGLKAAQHVENLKTTKAVFAEAKAKPLLEAVRKLDVTLTGKPRSFDPSLPQFQKDNAALLLQLKESIDRVKKASPGTRALEEALFIGDKYLVKMN